MARNIKVGPDGRGSYRYEIGGKLSVPYHNAVSARVAAYKPQLVNSDGLLEPIR